jgi:hypothetical protein
VFIAAPVVLDLDKGEKSEAKPVHTESKKAVTA